MNESSDKSNIHYMLGEISSDVKGIMRRLDDGNKWMTDHEKRISTIEQTSANLSGAARVWGIIAAAATSFVIGIAEIFISRK